MGRFRAGDQVASIKDIGGWTRDSVPKGTPGVVIEADSWSSDALVRFRIPGGWFSNDRTVDVRVSNDEIA